MTAKELSEKIVTLTMFLEEGKARRDEINNQIAALTTELTALQQLMNDQGKNRSDYAKQLLEMTRGAPS